MRLLLTLSVALALLTGCTSAKISSARAPGVQINPTGIRVVFEESNLQSKSVAGLTRENEINQQRLMLGNSVIELFPERLKENKLPASSKSLSTLTIPASRDFSSLFPENQKNWHTLIVTPTTVAVTCSVVCGYTFRVSLRLIDPADNKVAWSATVDQPTVNLSAGGRQGAYNNFVNEMVKAFLNDLTLTNASTVKRM